MSDRYCKGCGKKLPHLVPSRIKHGRGKFCSYDCANKNMPSENMEDRFWRYVQKTDGCWVWTGAKCGRGYGSFRVNKPRRQVTSHRISWQIHFGDIPKGQQVLHKCDNPPCVRPDHLFLGTNIDNMIDKSAKGRQTKGSKITWSKLTEENVSEIKRELGKRGSAARLARRFNVSTSNISRIKHGLAWTHVK